MVQEVWKNWKLWQKICFILAVLLFFVLLYALIVVVSNRKRAKKYNNLLQNHDAERGEIYRAVEMKRKQAAVPFGARAIHVGVGVDGVFIPKNTPTTTPVDGSPVATPPRSPRLRADRSTSRTRAARVSCHSVAEEDESTPVPPGHAKSAPRRPSLSLSEFGHTQNRRDRGQSSASVVSDESLNHQPISAQMRPISMDQRAPRSGRSTAKHTSGPPTAYSAAAFEALATYGKAPSRTMDSGTSRRSLSAGPSHARDVSSDRDTDFINAEVEESLARDRNSDLDSIHSYRLSHAAEMGQLVPRSRRSRQNSDESHTHHYAPVRDVSVESVTRLPEARKENVSGPSLMQPETITALPPVDLDKFPSRRPNERRKRTSVSAGSTAETSAETTTGVSHRNSVARRVNPGFEVLPAGTFGSQIPAPSQPLSEDDQARKPRKLQKRRPSSASSRHSAMPRDRSSEPVEPNASVRPMSSGPDQKVQTGRARSSSFHENL